MKKLLLVLFVMFLCVVSVSAADTSSTPSSGGEDGGGGIVSGLLDGLKGLFIPDEDFFVAWNDDISSAWDAKVGGITRSWEAITDQFKELKSPTEENKISFELKDNHFFDGYKGVKVDLLDGIDDFSKLIKGLISSAIVIFTIFFGYKKIIHMFRG